MPWYRTEGKIEVPLTDQDFKEGMDNGYFVEDKHRAYCVLLYYTAIRKHEGLRVVREQFQVKNDVIMFDVKKRMKKGKETPQLPLPLDVPFMEELKEAVENTKQKERVFPYCDKTGYNIVRRAFKYPHLFRLSRITNFFLQGFSIAELKNWTGLTLAALEYYVGLTSVDKMAKSLVEGFTYAE